jgi:hypothetical protein
MKKKFVFYAASLSLTITMHAQTATNMVILDTRAENNGPNNYSKELRCEFKFRDAIGVPGSGDYSGMLTIAPWGDNTGNKHHQLNFNDGGIFYRTGWPSYTTWDSWVQLWHSGNLNKADVDFNAKNIILNGNLSIGNWYLANNSWPGTGGFTYVGNDITFGIHTTDGQASLQIDGAFIQAEAGKTNFYAGASTFNNVVNFPAGVWNNSGNVGIGTTTPGNYQLNVAGRIRANEIVVNTTGADFVFENNYKLRPLAEVETFIKQNKHLPDIAPATEMQANGVSMGDMQAKLLEQVERLTLYIIEQQKNIEKQNQRIIELEKTSKK